MPTALPGGSRSSEAVQKACAGTPYHFVDVLKATRAAVVGVGYFVAVGLVFVGTQKLNQGVGALFFAHAFEGEEIVSIHRDDVVEVCEIRGPHLATARVEAEPMLFGHEDRSGIGTLADMPGSGARAVDLELIG